MIDDIKQLAEKAAPDATEILDAILVVAFDAPDGSTQVLARSGYESNSLFRKELLTAAVRLV